jgi:hypothetical protein
VCVFRLGSEFGRGAKKLHQSFAGGLACPLLEEVSRSFHHSNFFGDRCRDPLVQRHAIFFREPLGSLLEEIQILEDGVPQTIRHFEFFVGHDAGDNGAASLGPEVASAPPAP